MLPAKAQPYVFGLILSGLMSCVVSGIATFRALGLIDGFFGAWMGSWISSWVVAFPTVLIVAPTARKLAARLVRQPDP